MAHILTKLNPWLASPIIVSAPMLGAATPTLAANVTKAGGLGFLPGVTKGNTLEISLRQAAELTQTTFLQAKVKKGIIPVGVGFQLWNCQLDVATKVFGKHTPAVAWLFAPKELAEFANWARGIRKATERRTQIWVQVGTVAEARAAVEMAEPDVIVVQGSDAGGHGLARSASVMALVPEVLDLLESLGRSNVPVLAAGGITEGRGVAGALALGASGVVMGTRFLAATEAGIPQGWKNEITRLADGGASTTRSTLCDRLKETKGWPAWYDGRAAVNRGHEDEEAGMCDEDNVARYKEEAAKGDESWGPHGRMVTYAGTGVGMIRDVKAAADIVEEVRAQSRIVLQRTSAEYAWPRAGPRL